MARLSGLSRRRAVKHIADFRLARIGVSWQRDSPMSQAELFKFWNQPVSLQDNAGTKWGEGELNCMPLPGKNRQSWFLVIQSDQVFEGVFGMRVDLTDEMIDAIARDGSGHLSLKLPRRT